MGSYSGISVLAYILAAIAILWAVTDTVQIVQRSSDLQQSLPAFAIVFWQAATAAGLLALGAIVELLSTISKKLQQDDAA